MEVHSMSKDSRGHNGPVFTGRAGTMSHRNHKDRSVAVRGSLATRPPLICSRKTSARVTSRSSSRSARSMIWSSTLRSWRRSRCRSESCLLFFNNGSRPTFCDHPAGSDSVRMITLVFGLRPLQLLKSIVVTVDDCEAVTCLIHPKVDVRHVTSELMRRQTRVVTKHANEGQADVVYIRHDLEPPPADNEPTFSGGRA